MDNRQMIDIIARAVADTIYAESKGLNIPIGVSNRHVHLSQKDLDILFGAGYNLHIMRDLGQPGQYAAEETVAVKGPKGSFDRVRILGPVRNESQVEISLTDSFQLGIKVPIRQSGQLEGTPGVELVGPAGSMHLKRGVIVALRHIHMTPEQAELSGVADKSIVQVEVPGERGCILKQVLVRVSDMFALEMHVDVDEANACSLKNGDVVRISKQ